MMSDELERKIKRLTDLVKDLFPPQSEEEAIKLKGALDERLDAERQLSKLRNESYAIPLNEISIEWLNKDANIRLISGTCQTLLLIGLQPDDVLNPEVYPWTVVSFYNCVETKTTQTTEQYENFLAGKGFRPYSAQEIINSKWLADFVRAKQKSDSIGEYDASLRHLGFWFEEFNFECLTLSFKVETFETSLEALVAKLL